MSGEKCYAGQVAFLRAFLTERAKMKLVVLFNESSNKIKYEIVQHISHYWHDDWEIMKENGRLQY